MKLIDADALENVLREHKFNYSGQSDYFDGVVDGIMLAIDDVKEAPTIKAEPIRHGKWIYKEFEIPKVEYYECSKCGYVTFNVKSCHYCYNCGAKMEIANEDAD